MENAANTSFAEWVSATAKGLGYRTDAQLAAAIGVQQSTVTRWRQGNQPQIKHLVALARLFQMKIGPLLAVSGHVPADLLSDAGPPEPPLTESFRRIRDAPLTDFQKAVLSQYWEQRLWEERQRLGHLIDWIASTEDRPRPEVGTSVVTTIIQGARSSLVTHVAELVERLVAVDATPRRRKRRATQRDPFEGPESWDDDDPTE